MLLNIYLFMEGMQHIQTELGSVHIMSTNLQWLSKTLCPYLSMGRRVYKEIWSPVIGETMRWEREIDKQ